jgi:hypothetical protein
LYLLASKHIAADVWSCEAERGNKGHVKKRQLSWGPKAFRQIEDGACQKRFE